MDVTIRFTENMLGTAPKHQEVYTKFILSEKRKHEKKHRNDQQERPTDQEELASLPDETPDEKESSGWTTFRRDDNGLFLPVYMMRGFLKEAAFTVKDKLGIRALKARITTNFFVLPPVGSPGKNLYLNMPEPDGTLERPLRADTMQGPRVTVVRSDAVEEGAELSFRIRAIPHKDFVKKGVNKEGWRDVMKTVLAYGSLKGLGQWRSGGFGTFVVTKIDNTEIDPDEYLTTYLEPLMED